MNALRVLIIRSFSVIWMESIEYRFHKLEAIIISLSSVDKSTTNWEPYKNLAGLHQSFGLNIPGLFKDSNCQGLKFNISRTRSDNSNQKCLNIILSDRIITRNQIQGFSSIKWTFCWSDKIIFASLNVHFKLVTNPPFRDGKAFTVPIAGWAIAALSRQTSARGSHTLQ